MFLPDFLSFLDIYISNKFLDFPVSTKNFGRLNLGVDQL